MQKIIPTHLVSTYQLIKCAFPQEIDDESYLPLLSLLYEHMSDRSLAQVIAEYTGKDYHIVLNEVYQVGAMETFSPDATKPFRIKLMGCGYERWLADE
ncbi:hypothetical protein NIES4071_19130 [Calothrix sp. NIES-4071]|nr:hypothetical protein NIES4071_19130 [Calothrix sp. NIES-4071]BAZ56246.1 hypothetical protein NIES4105_19080 [Calothrix sp. NIES-4105]